MFVHTPDDPYCVGYRISHVCRPYWNGEEHVNYPDCPYDPRSGKAQAWRSGVNDEITDRQFARSYRLQRRKTDR